MGALARGHQRGASEREGRDDAEMTRAHVIDVIRYANALRLADASWFDHAMSRIERWVGSHRHVDDRGLHEREMHEIEMVAQQVAGKRAVLAGEVAAALVVGIAGLVWLRARVESEPLLLAIESLVIAGLAAASIEAIHPVRFVRRVTVALIALPFALLGVSLALPREHAELALALGYLAGATSVGAAWRGAEAWILRIAILGRGRGLVDRMRADAVGERVLRYEHTPTPFAPPPPDLSGTIRGLPFQTVSELPPSDVEILPTSSVIFRVGGLRVVESLQMAHVAHVAMPDDDVIAASDDSHPGQRSLSAEEIAELREHVRREGRALARRTLSTFQSAIIAGRWLDAGLRTSAYRLAPRAVVFAVVIFLVLIAVQSSDYRKLRRDLRDGRTVRVGSTASGGEALAHSRRPWTAIGRPAGWRTRV